MPRHGGLDIPAIVEAWLPRIEHGWSGAVDHGVDHALIQT